MNIFKAFGIVEYRLGDCLNLHASPSVGQHHDNFTHSPHTEDLNDKLHYGLLKTLCLGWNYILTYFLNIIPP